MPRGLGTPLLGPSEAAGVSRIEKRVELQKIAKKLLRGLVHPGVALGSLDYEHLMNYFESLKESAA
jgi:hypothetical protein